MRSRTHRASAALHARSAHVPPPQQREGIGPTPTHRRNHTSTRPQHVHTGRREGREATGGYAHRCEVVALLVASLGPARTCRAPRAQGRRRSTARACRPYTPNRPHTARVSSRPVPADQLGRREPLRVATHRRLAPLGARCRRVPAAPRAGGRGRAVLRRLAARGGGQPALSARGLPEHTAPGVRRPGLSVRGAWGRPEHRRGGRGYGAGQHIAAGCSLSAGSATRRAAVGALRSRRPSCSGSPSGGATPPARCGQGRAPRRPRSRRSRSSSSGAANGRPQNAGGGRALPRRRASCIYLSRL